MGTADDIYTQAERGKQWVSCFLFLLEHQEWRFDLYQHPRLDRTIDPSDLLISELLWRGVVGP